MRVLSNIAFWVFVASGLIFAQPGENKELPQNEKVAAIVIGKQITYENISPNTSRNPGENRRAGSRTSYQCLETDRRR